MKIMFFLCFTINVAQFTVTAGSVTRISTTIPFSFVAYYQHRKFATSGSTDPMRLVPWLKPKTAWRAWSEPDLGIASVRLGQRSTSAPIFRSGDDRIIDTFRHTSGSCSRYLSYSRARPAVPGVHARRNVSLRGHAASAHPARSHPRPQPTLAPSHSRSLGSGTHCILWAYDLAILFCTSSPLTLIMLSNL